MKTYYWLALALIITLASCSKSNQTETSEDSDTTVVETDVAILSGTVIDLNAAIKKIGERVSTNGELGPNFNEFKIFLDEEDRGDIYSISVAEDMVKKYIKVAKQPYIDSSFLFFRLLVNKAVAYQSDSLEMKHHALTERLLSGTEDAETQALQAYYSLFGIEMLTTEGMYYLDSKPDYFLNIYNYRASDELQTFLEYEKKEKEEGFSEDAALRISFENLYDRVLRWEDYIKNNSKSIVIEDAFSNYQIYLNTLLTGMDNSRIFSFEDETLNPEMKILYENAIANHPDLKSTEVIKSYYEFLKGNNFKYSDKIYDFLSSQKLTGMLGIQPPTR